MTLSKFYTKASPYTKLCQITPINYYQPLLILHPYEGPIKLDHLMEIPRLKAKFKAS